MRADVVRTRWRRRRGRRKEAPRSIKRDMLFTIGFKSLIWIGYHCLEGRKCSQESEIGACVVRYLDWELLEGPKQESSLAKDAKVIEHLSQSLKTTNNLKRKLFSRDTYRCTPKANPVPIVHLYEL